MSAPTYRTAPPAAVPGSVPAPRRCHSRRALALRVVPLRVQLDQRYLRRAYRVSGPDGLAAAVRWALLDLAGSRATTDDERRVLTAWFRYTVGEVTADYLARAEAEGWPGYTRQPPDGISASGRRGVRVVPLGMNSIRKVGPSTS
ncbi:hypothetical protein Nm8I071_66420 [Nonomuraea sp. TT08I-71]|nr:hypothetical protein Nm8I071_66420 [Nonomuraea sp. TT08I-71]